MEGHSDTSFDGNLQCRLYALRQLQRLQNPSTEKNWDINTHLITMWKTGYYQCIIIQSHLVTVEV